MLITNDQELRSYLPNALVTVEGEMSLYEKLSSDLNEAESWLASYITGAVPLQTIADNAEDAARPLVCRIVVCHALFHAIPSLDLVLTPNGFGIVSNQNIAPASRERVERLIASVEQQRDDAIILLQKQLFSRNEWQQSEVFGYWSQTLLPNISVCHQLHINEHRFTAYRALVPRIIQIEDELAHSFISPELLEHLHSYQFGIGYGDFSPAEQSGRAYVLTHLQAEIVSQLNGQPPRYRFMTDLVNVIRSQPDIFPLWHESETAKLFTPPVFVNKKESQGYFF